MWWFRRRSSQVAPEFDNVTGWVEGNVKRMGPKFGYVSVPGETRDVYLHPSVLPSDKDGIRIRPKNGSKVEVRYGTRSDKPELLGVVEIKVFERYVPEDLDE